MNDPDETQSSVPEQGGGDNIMDQDPERDYEQDDDAYDEGLLIEDSVQSINLLQNSFPIILIYRAPPNEGSSVSTGSKKTFGQLVKVAGMNPRVRFNYDQHASHLTLRFIYDHHPVNEVATIRLPFKALREAQMTMTTISEQDHPQYINNGVLDSAYERLYQLTVKDYDPTFLSAENVFVTTDSRGYFNDARAMFAPEVKEFTCIIRGTKAVEIDFDTLQKRQAAELKLYHEGETSFSVWYPGHPKQAFIQAGDYPPANYRPKYAYPEAKYSFMGRDEYLTVHGFGAIAEWEHTRFKTEGEHTLRLKLMFIPGCGDRRFFGLLIFPLDTSIRLSPGDRLTITFDIDTDSSRHRWSASVLEPLPFAAADEVTIMLTRPWDKEERVYLDPKTPLDVINFAGAVGEDEAFRRVRQAPAHTVLVHIIDSDKHFKRQMNTLRLLPSVLDQNSVLEQALLANRPAELPTVDMFEHCRQKRPHIEQEIDLSADQISRAKTYQENKGPLALLQGPPGTGKTYVACRLALGFIECMPRQKILLVSAMNNSVDATALHLNELLKGRPVPEGSKPVMLIRLHTLTTEIEVTQRKAKAQRGPEPNARPKIVDEAELATDMAGIEYADMMSQFYRANTEGKRPHGIADERLKLIDLSLGNWMLKKAGLVDQGGAFDEGEKWVDFVESYMQFKSGTLAADDMTEFRARTKELRESTLKQADVVACTLSQSADAALHDVYQGALALIEESARALEIDCLMPLVFSKPNFTLLIGDNQQLGPTVFSSRVDGDNVFAPQLRTSLFTRLRNAGYRCPILNENRRMQPENAKLIQNLYYRRYGLNFVTPDIPFREVAKRVEDFNQKEFDHPTTVIWIDIPKGRACKEISRKSKFNQTNAAAAINLVIKLLEMHVVDSGNHIIILTPYHAQYVLVWVAITLLRLDRPDLPIDGLSVAKIDGFQGSERKIVICDLVVDRTLGFVRVANRLNVGLSRARCGLYILGNRGQMEQNKKSRARHITALIDYCKEDQIFWSYRDIKPASRYVRTEQMEASLPKSVQGQDNQQTSGGWGADNAAPAPVVGDWDKKPGPAFSETSGWGAFPNPLEISTQDNAPGPIHTAGTTEPGDDNQRSGGEEAQGGEKKEIGGGTTEGSGVVTKMPGTW